MNRSAVRRVAVILPDDYPAVYLHLDELFYPLLSSNTAINPMGDWNKVFIPYCIGDTYLGSRVKTYVDPDGVGPAVQ